MTALHRVKAYFGMVPADELDAYDGYDDPRYDGRYDDGRYEDRHDDRRRWESERSEPRYDDRYADRRADRHAGHSGHSGHEDRYDDRRDAPRRPAERPADAERYPSDRADRPRPVPSAAARAESGHGDDGHAPTGPPRPRDGRDPEGPHPEVPSNRREESEVETQRSSRGRSWATNTGPNHTSVRPTSVGSTRSAPSLSPISSPTGAPGSLGSSGGATRGALAVDASRDTGNNASGTPDDSGSAPAEITSLRPTGYDEARVIGERYRDGIPVIMNLTDMDEVAAKRLVDFAAGLAFALRGSIEKVTNRVFLLSPPNVEVSAAERRKLAENS